MIAIVFELAGNTCVASVPEGRDVEAEARQIVPPGKPFILASRAALPTSPPETWAVDYEAGSISADPELLAAHIRGMEVPRSITRAQGKAILIIDGMWSDVLAVVDAIPDPVQKAMAEIAMHEQVTWLRDSPTLLMLAGAIGLTEEQVDELFIRAAQVKF